MLLVHYLQIFLKDYETSNYNFIISTYGGIVAKQNLHTFTSFNPASSGFAYLTG